MFLLFCEYIGENNVRDNVMRIKTDVVIVGCGVSGLYCALNLPKHLKIIMITKSDRKSSDSFLAQGGICVLKDAADYDSYVEDTMRAGHYENRRESVDIMIRSSREVIDDLIGYGVEFERDEQGRLKYTREGAHSTPRILFHQDITGEEITGKLLARVQALPNVTILEHTAMIDIVEQENRCFGVLCVQQENSVSDKDSGAGQDIFVVDDRKEKEQLSSLKLSKLEIVAEYTVLASGGLGGIYRHSTNYRHLTGDALAICKRHGVRLQDIDYIQIHPTTFYSKKPGRRFLISESVRGEGAVLYNAKGERFCNELLPRDVVTAEVKKQMETDGTEYVMLSMEHIPVQDILAHFPNIYQRCKEEGYDVTKEPIPVVPAQHYFMGGIYVDSFSKTTMDHLYAVGETSCNGVHGANRLASNSLLESLVFAGRAAGQIKAGTEESSARGEAFPADGEDSTILSEKYQSARMRTPKDVENTANLEEYSRLQNTYKKIIQDEIERMKKNRE